MMNTYDYDMISQYVDGELSGEELKNFEQQLQQDEKLKQQVELYKDVQQNLKENLFLNEDELVLRNTLEKMNEEYFKPKAKIISFKEMRFWVSATAAIILVVLLIWSPWKQDLYKQFASIEMLPVSERGGVSDSLLKKATTDFNDKKFTEAIPDFETILKMDPANSYVQFYYAVALLQADKVDSSRNEFMKLYTGVSVFKYNAAFYIALSYVKVKDKVKAKEWLDKIPADASVKVKALNLEKKL